MTVGDNIKRLREEKGISVKEVSEKLEINEPSIRDLENGDFDWHSGFAIGKLIELSELLGLSILELILEKEEGIESNSYKDLSRQIQSHIDEGNSKDDLPWEVDPVLTNPNEVNNYTIMFLMDFGEILGVDWRSYLSPEKHNQAIVQKNL